MFFTIVQTTLNGYGFEWVSLLGLLAIILAISTISSKNPINSVLFLIGLFIVISLYLIMFDMTFIAISYLLVYVGAVSILFLFIVMLINIRISELLTEGKNSVVLAVLVVISFGFIFNNKIPYVMEAYEGILGYLYRLSEQSVHTSNFNTSFNLITQPITSVNYSSLAEVISKNWDNSVSQVTHISAIGNILYNALFINLLIVAMILLVAMVGAIVITVKPKDNLN